MKIELEEIKPSNRRYPYVDFKPDRMPGNEILQAEGIIVKQEWVKAHENEPRLTA